jgi:hypothetical protein
MRVQALRAQLAVRRVNEPVIRGLAWPRGIQDDAICIGPKVKIPRDELTAVVDPDCLGLADLTANILQGLDNILAPIGKPGIGCRAKAGMDVDDRQTAELVSQCQLVVNEVPLRRL